MNIATFASCCIDTALAVGANDSVQWVARFSDGTAVRLRAINAGDTDLEREFIMGLSAETRRLRFFGTIKEPTPAFLRQLTDIDHWHDVAFVALADLGGAEHAVGIARYSLSSDGTSCECAVAVADNWHRRGLASALMRHLIDIARARGIRTMHSVELASNYAMQRLADNLGFLPIADPDDGRQVLHCLQL